MGSLCRLAGASRHEWYVLPRHFCYIDLLVTEVGRVDSTSLHDAVEVCFQEHCQIEFRVQIKCILWRQLSVLPHDEIHTTTPMLSF